MDTMLKAMSDLYQSNPNALVGIYTVIFFALVLIFTIPAIILIVVLTKKIMKKMHFFDPLDFLKEQRNTITKIAPETKVKCQYCGNRGTYNNGFCNRCGRSWGDISYKQKEKKNED